MPRYAAFLRSINIGGRVVKMADLKRVFESLGFKRVETLIASGNVLFDTTMRSDKSIEKKIEDAFEKEFGYRVSAYVRSGAELDAILDCGPCRKIEEGTGLYIAFVSEPVSERACKDLAACPSKTDSFHVTGREIHWLCNTRFSDSEFSGPRLEKILGVPATVRNSTTVRKVAEKLR